MTPDDGSVSASTVAGAEYVIAEAVGVLRAVQAGVKVMLQAVGAQGGPTADTSYNVRSAWCLADLRA